MNEQEDKIIYTTEQFYHIMEMLINANRVIAAKFMISKLHELGFYVMDKDKLSSRIELLNIMEKVHEKNPELDEEEVMNDILEAQHEVRTLKK